MKQRALYLAPCLLLAPLAATVHADITLSANLSFAEQGGTIGAGNLGTTGTAFAKDVIFGGSLAPTHTIANVNNGTYGNPSSWIGDSANSYIGIAFGAAQNIASFAFGRDNTGTFGDRAAGLYTVEYTNDADPFTNHASASWSNLGTVTLADGQGILSALRHRINVISPVSATGIRLITPGSGAAGGAAVDEFEIYSTPGAVVPLPPGIVTTGAPGYSIAWDGNDGDNFSAAAIAPDNLARPAHGGTAIGSGSLGPQIGVPFHVIANLNDGLYGNSNSWIGGDGDPAPYHAGIMLGGLHEVTTIAFGRDNGLDAAGGDCCGGQARDRNLGTYTLQRTLDGSSWETIGTIALNYSEDDIPGGGATTFLRHEFEISDGDGGVLAKGLRLLVPGTGIGAGGTAIDEIEIYGTPVPEPAGAGLLALGAAVLMRRRRA